VDRSCFSGEAAMIHEVTQNKHEPDSLRNLCVLCSPAVSLVVPSTQQASEVRFSNLGFVDRWERK
jgi:hypothetical protein